MSDVPCRFHSLEKSVKCIACENVSLTARLAEAEESLDAAREWIRRHYDQWDVCSPAAHDMRAEMPWLEETP